MGGDVTIRPTLHRPRISVLVVSKFTFALRAGGTRVNGERYRGVVVRRDHRHGNAPRQHPRQYRRRRMAVPEHEQTLLPMVLPMRFPAAPPGGAPTPDARSNSSATAGSASGRTNDDGAPEGVFYDDEAAAAAAADAIARQAGRIPIPHVERGVGRGGGTVTPPPQPILPEPPPTARPPSPSPSSSSSSSGPS